MGIRKVRLKLEPDELPSGFSYPASFLEFAQAFPEVEDEFDPWGVTADVESSQLWSEAFGRPLLQFAQAWLEDMVACFVIDGSTDPAVVVINPWAQRVVDGKTEKFCMLLEEFPSFTAWLDWMRESDLVRDHAADRAEEAGEAEGDEGDSSAERPR